MHVHFDHPWSECVRQDGSPVRLYLFLPWVVVTIGTPSQAYSWRQHRYLDRWSFITFEPRRRNRRR